MCTSCFKLLSGRKKRNMSVIKVEQQTEMIKNYQFMAGSVNIL